MICSPKWLNLYHLRGSNASKIPENHRSQAPENAALPPITAHKLLQLPMAVINSKCPPTCLSATKAGLSSLQIRHTCDFSQTVQPPYRPSATASSPQVSTTYALCCQAEQLLMFIYAMVSVLCLKCHCQGITCMPGPAHHCQVPCKAISKNPLRISKAPCK